MQSKFIPTPGNRPNTRADALHVFKVLQDGGVAVVPTEAGYALMASSTDAVQRAFAAKRRRLGHSQAFIGLHRLHRALHDLPDDKLDMIRVLHQDLDMSFGIVAPFRPDHPLIQKLSPPALEMTTRSGTVRVYIGGGSLLAELGRLNDETGQLWSDHGDGAEVSRGYRTRDPGRG